MKDNGIILLKNYDKFLLINKNNEWNLPIVVAHLNNQTLENCKDAIVPELKIIIKNFRKISSIENVKIFLTYSWLNKIKYHNFHWFTLEEIYDLENLNLWIKNNLSDIWFISRHY